MKFTKVRAPDFDLEKTLDSGQVFHWQKVGDGCVGAIEDRAIYLEQRGEFLKVRFGGTPPRLPRRPLPGGLRAFLNRRSDFVAPLGPRTVIVAHIVQA